MEDDPQGNPKIVLPFEFYSSEKILIFLPRLPPYRHLEQEFAESLVEWILSQQFEQIMLIGGVDRSLKEDKNQNVRYVPTSKFLSMNQDKIKENILDSGLMIQGPLALMLGLLDIEKKSALGVLAYAERDRPDPQGAAFAIEALNEIILNSLNLKCSTKELIQNAQLYEDELKNIPSQNGKSGPPETYS